MLARVATAIFLLAIFNLMVLADGKNDFVFVWNMFGVENLILDRKWSVQGNSSTCLTVREQNFPYCACAHCLPHNKNILYIS